MKGLLIKDLYCLKKQLTTYCFVIVGVVVLSILFVLSYRFGNIHAGLAGMVASGKCSETDVSGIASIALLLFMMLPIACTGDIFSLFQEDENASFYKVASSFPVSVSRRVLVRYIIGLLFIGVGTGIDFLLTIVLASLTDIVSFGEFMGMIISFASVMVMYISLLILLMHLLGKGRGIYANIIPVLFGIGVLVGINFDRLKKFFMSEDDAALQGLYQDMRTFITCKSSHMLAAAVVILLGSYILSVIVEKRKRGVA